MRPYRVPVVIVSFFLALFLSVQSWSQQIRIIDCEGIVSPGYSLPGCSDFDDDMLWYSQMLAYRALEFAHRLPDDLYIDIRFSYEDVFNYQEGQGEPDRITVGEGMLIDMWNRYVDIWDMYEYDGDAYDSDADYKAFIEWALYHEIGHALVTHTGYEHDDKDHETLADDFATITMIRLYPNATEEGGIPAEQAAQGLYFLSLPDTQRVAQAGSDKRNAFTATAPKKLPKPAQRGVDGNMGAHEPNPERAWMIACLVHSSGLAEEYPGDYQTDSAEVYECSSEEYYEILDELVEYAPSLEYSN